ncbi:MAG: hypothetical protein ABI740_02210 [Alphaproteobacteria bacterium]
MRYFLDTEFNGFGGALISLALVSETGTSLYLVYGIPPAPDPFVRDHVQPKLLCVPANVEVRHVDQATGARAIEAFLHPDPDPQLIADWPDDVRLCCQALMISPERTAPIDHLSFEIHRVESYPTELAGAVEHNAWWDAMALRDRLKREITPRNRV